jgi:hypothetical protein
MQTKSEIGCLGQRPSCVESGASLRYAPATRRWIRALRFALTAIIVFAACYVSYGFGRLWKDWRNTASPALAANTANADIESMVNVLPLSGQWSFGDLDWTFRSKVVDAGTVEARLAETADIDSGKSADELPDLSPELVDLARKLKIRPVSHGENQLYRLERPEMKAQLVVRQTAGQPKAVAMIAAMKQPSGEWQLFEFAPRTAAVAESQSTPHLLPLPASARRTGGRFTDDGQLLLELANVDADADSLTSMWNDAGWNVRSTQFAGPGDFSYLCVRGDSVVYAWSADARGSLQHLMLTRAK